jgi:hypothetical protein
MSATTLTKRKGRGEPVWIQSILEDDLDKYRQLDRNTPIKFFALFEQLFLFTTFKSKTIFFQFNVLLMQEK